MDGIKYNTAAVLECLNHAAIMCIQEHWLWSFEAGTTIEKLIPDKSYHIRSSDEYHNIEPIAVPRGNGGIATIWNKDLDPFAKRTNEGNERILVTKFEFNKANKICIINCYLPAGEGKRATEDFADDIALIDNLLQKYSGFQLLILGDMNADILHRKGKKEKLLMDLLARYKLQNLNENSHNIPTYIHQSGISRSHIDYIIASENCKWSDFLITTNESAEGTLNSSPHNAIGATVHLRDAQLWKRIEKPQAANKAQRHTPWKEVNPTTYKDAVTYQLSRSNIQHLNTEEAMSTLASIMQKAALKAQTRKPPKQRKSTKMKKIWTPKIAIALKSAKRAFWEWKEGGRPGKQHHLSRQKEKTTKRLRSEQRIEAAKRRATLLQQVMQAAENDDKTFHKLISLNKKGGIQTAALLQDGNLIYDETEQRNMWAEYFGRLSSSNEKTTENEATMLDLIRKCHANSRSHNVAYTSYDVEKAIRSLNKGKSPDLQGVTAEHLQHAPTDCIAAITTIINQIFQEATMPNICKSGFKIPIPKKGKDDKVMSNHRGITITSLLGKVIEKLLQEDTDASILSTQNDLQFGFTKGLSPTMASLCLTEALASAKEEKQQLYVASLDVQKAFDVVSQEKLKIKLHMENLPSTTWSLVDNIYENIEESVRWKGSYSQTFEVAKGVRQGAILSTSLYKLYINDLLNSMAKANVGISLGNVYAGTPTCADDQLLIANSKEEMQAMLQAVHQYAELHLYSIHPSKSSITNFTSSDNTAQEVFWMGEEAIPLTDAFVHLGLEWNAGKCSPNIATRIQQARRASYALMGVGLHGGNGLNPIVSCKIISTYIVPRLLYGLDAVILQKKDIEDISTFHKNRA